MEGGRRRAEGGACQSLAVRDRGLDCGQASDCSTVHPLPSTLSYVDRVELTIEGMTCEHCVRAVRNRLAHTPGVEVERVDVGSAVIRLDPGATSVEAVEDAIADEGYTAYLAG